LNCSNDWFPATVYRESHLPSAAPGTLIQAQYDGSDVPVALVGNADLSIALKYWRISAHVRSGAEDPPMASHNDAFYSIINVAPRHDPMGLENPDLTKNVLLHFSLHLKVESIVRLGTVQSDDYDWRDILGRRRVMGDLDRRELHRIV
jgi:hypothetical protein